jgi:CRISPR-associated protein Csb1
MSEAEKKSPPRKLTPADVLKGESPLVLTATLEPIAGDRFQPAGFPEIGHVIYKAPRKDGSTENVCIVDSAASMANHLETVCQRGAHDLELVDELRGMPYIRCVTGDLVGGKLPQDKREMIVTSLTEGHRIASTYFLEGRYLKSDEVISAQLKSAKDEAAKAEKAFNEEQDEHKKKELEKQVKEKAGAAKKLEEDYKFQASLIQRFGIVLPGSSKAHPPPEKWWDVFKGIFEIDPNSLVHGVLFPQWQIKIPRALSAHLEAFGAGRVDRSGVKFDKELGPKSDKRVQAIFAVDDATAESIRATFVIDVSLIRSFGRTKNVEGKDTQLGLSEKQQEFLVALALWKIQKLLASPFRFRSGCHLKRTAIKSYEQDVELEVDIARAINDASFRSEKSADDKPVPPLVTDVFWPREELYREGQAEAATSAEEDAASEETAG